MTQKQLHCISGDNDSYVDCDFPTGNPASAYYPSGDSALDDANHELSDSCVDFSSWILWEICCSNIKEDDASFVGFDLFITFVDRNDINRHVLTKVKLNKDTLKFNLNKIVDDPKRYRIRFGLGSYKEPIKGTNDADFNGYVRDLMMFSGRLTPEQSKTLYLMGIQPSYIFRSMFDTSDISKEFTSNSKFFIGLLGSYDNDDINIINCNFKFDGKKYVFSSNEA